MPLATETFRVTMGDTDAAQLIYYGAPLRWAERITSSWLCSIGRPTSAALTSGRGFPAVHSETSYHAPLRLDDEVRAELWVDKHSTRSFTLRTDFYGPGAESPSVLVRVTQVHVEVVDDGIRAIPLPDDMIAAFAGS